MVQDKTWCCSTTETIPLSLSLQAEQVGEAGLPPQTAAATMAVPGRMGLTGRRAAEVVVACTNHTGVPVTPELEAVAPHFLEEVVVAVWT